MTCGYTTITEAKQKLEKKIDSAGRWYQIRSGGEPEQK